MSVKPFSIDYLVNNKSHTVEIRPCCGEDSIADYAVWQKERLLFTVTKNNLKGFGWIVALRNAEMDIPEKLVEIIGDQIDKRK